jgi:hypothetical protein
LAIPKGTFYSKTYYVIDNVGFFPIDLTQTRERTPKYPFDTLNGVLTDTFPPF